jgi:hypothetical protein
VIRRETAAAEQLVRIERLIEQYSAAKRRQRLRLALKLWRKAEADQRLTRLELAPERVQ